MESSQAPSSPPGIIQDLDNPLLHLPVELLRSVCIQLPPNTVIKTATLSRGLWNRCQWFIDDRFATENLARYCMSQPDSKVNDGVHLSLSQLIWWDLPQPYWTSLLTHHGFTRATLKLLNPTFTSINSMPQRPQPFPNPLTTRILHALTTHPIDVTLDGHFPLLWCISQNATAAVSKFLESSKPTFLSTLIFYATRFGSLECLKLVMEVQGRNPAPGNQKCELRMGVMSLAASHGFTDIVEHVADIMIQEHAKSLGNSSVNEFLVSQFYKCIRVASVSGQVDVMESLFNILSTHFSIDFSKSSITPNIDRHRQLLFPALTNASMFGQIHAVRCLLLRNIIPCPLIIDPDEALRIAAEHKHMDIVELLLNSRYFNPDCNNLTVLTQACKVGHEPIVKHMLTLLATRLSDINLCKHASTSPNVPPHALCLELSDAVNAACESGHAGILRLFLIHGVNVSKQALRKAAEGGHQDVVEILLDTGQVDPIQGLFAASLKGHVEIVKLLLNRYPNISLKDIEASFYDATKEGHVSVMKLLLDAMIVETDQLHVRSSGLTYASVYGHEKAVEFILACQGVNPSANNNAAMEAAIKVGSIGIVRMLIETKRLRISSWVAENMVRVAEENGYVEISKILRSL